MDACFGFDHLPAGFAHWSETNGWFDSFRVEEDTGAIKVITATSSGPDGLGGNSIAIGDAAHALYTAAGAMRSPVVRTTFCVGMGLYLTDATPDGYLLGRAIDRVGGFPFVLGVNPTTLLPFISVGYDHAETSDQEATSTVALTTGEWNYLEVKVLIDGSSGTCEFRVGNASGGAFTGLNTNGGSTSNVEQWWLGGLAVASGTEHYWSRSIEMRDFYLSDDFENAHVMKTDRPDSDGAQTDWTPDTGPNNFEEVSEATPSDATGNESNTAANRDLFGFPAAPTGGSITNIGYSVRLGRTAPGQHTARVVSRESATDALGTTVAPPSAHPRVFSNWSDTKPSGGAWDATAADATEAGVEVVA